MIVDLWLVANPKIKERPWDWRWVGCFGVAIDTEAPDAKAKIDAASAACIDAMFEFLSMGAEMGIHNVGYTTNWLSPSTGGVKPTFPVYPHIKPPVS